MNVYSSILTAFDIDESKYSVVPIHSGHINDSFTLKSKHENHPNYFLQKINSDIFPNVEHLMSNINKAISLQKENPYENQGILCLIKNGKNSYYEIPKANEYWRIYKNLDNFISANDILSPDISARIGTCSAQFIQQMNKANLRDFHKLIPDFHNLKTRLFSLQNATKINHENRFNLVSKELEIINSLADHLLIIQQAIDSNKIPTRITHNDTKSSNFMVNQSTKKTCIIDLDTVMPSSLLFDFGDATRSLISFTSEDELGSETPELNWGLFVPYMNAFLETIEGLITEKEKELLQLSCVLLPFLMGVRFLSDFLSGDKYFKTTHSNQNWDRARNQLRLANEIYKYLPELKK